MTPNTDISNELQELIDQGDLDAIVISVDVTPKIEKPHRIHVPREIGLTSPIPEVTSMGIMNGESQKLFTDNPDREMYMVLYGVSNNTGSNYYFKKVKEPQPGKVYFVTDEDRITPSELKVLYNYKLYINPEEYCMWDIQEARYVDREDYPWSHYYEICYEVGK